MTKPRRRFCLFCRKLLRPDARNRGRQKYCSTPGCRQASKAASQRRWLSKPGNEDYFRGSANVARVQRWRKQNPGYWKRPREAQGTLQDTKTAQEPQPQLVVTQRGGGTLQDLSAVQSPLLVGLISQLVDSPLQETIEQMVSRLVSRGLNVLGMQPRAQPKGNHENRETGAVCAAAAAGAIPVQLD